MKRPSGPLLHDAGGGGGGGECDGIGGGGAAGARGSRQRAGVAARDHPVDEARDDARAGHDFEMAPDDAVEAKRVGIERDQAEIAGKTDEPPPSA